MTQEQNIVETKKLDAVLVYQQKMLFEFAEFAENYKEIEKLKGVVQELRYKLRLKDELLENESKKVKALKATIAAHERWANQYRTQIKTLMGTPIGISHD